MRGKQKGRLLIWLAAVLLLVAAALAAGTWLQEPEPGREPLAERYVPCPAGTEAKPAQPHICVPK